MTAGFEPAARLPGELDLLAAVASDLAEDTAKLAYADFLDEHADPRGAYLRRLVAAVRDGRDFPDPADLPIGWLELVGDPLERRIRECGEGPRRAKILARARPAVAIDTERAADDDFPIGASKFGGRPDLPRGAAWPRCEASPLQFHAQFDLSELSRTVAGRALPPAGLLSFFMYHDYPQDSYGEPEHGRGVPGGLHIIHTPPGAELHRLAPPDDLTADHGPPGRPCRLTLTEALDLPDGWKPRRKGDYERWPLVDGADHQLFGYARVTVLGEDPVPGPEWEQLLRFSSDDKLSWGWGDGHRLFWYIRTADLRAGRFDRTAAIDG